MLWQDSRVLDVGCGDKPLAYDLRDAGYTGNICRRVVRACGIAEKGKTPLPSAVYCIMSDEEG